MGKYNPQADIAAILAYTEREDADPAARFALISTLSRYQEQMRQLQNVKTLIEERGVMIETRDRRGHKILVDNPAVATYARLNKQANASASELVKLWRAARIKEG